MTFSQFICQLLGHEWKNHIRTPWKGLYKSKCVRCGKEEEYEKDYT